jgi:hypothetical protein
MMFLKIGSLATEIVGVLKSTIVLPLTSSVVFCMFASSGILGGYEAWGSERGQFYTALMVMSQPLFAVLSAWLAYTDPALTAGRRAGFRAVATITLGAAVADSMWMSGFALATMIVPAVARHFTYRSVLSLPLEIAFVIAVTFIMAIVLLLPPCATAVMASRACRGACQTSPEMRRRPRRAALPLSVLAYLALMVATWIAGSWKFSKGTASDSLMLPLILWLSGATIGCATSFAALSIRIGLDVARRRWFFAAAFLGFLIGLGILFHLCTESTGGEIWPPLFIVK